MSTLLQVKNLTCGYGKKHIKEVVHSISFNVEVGEFVCIIGANGCGKTTTLKSIIGLLPPLDGEIIVDGKNISTLSEKELAKEFAYIPQAHTPPFPFEVADVVLMGRTPHLNMLAKPTKNDIQIAYESLELLGISDLANIPYTSLSGGQQQLVLIARALTQGSNLLVMDEPTAALDFGNQQLVLSSVKMLTRIGKGVIMVTHDPDHALYCADKVIVIEDGYIIKQGTNKECITTETLKQIYKTNARVLDVEVDKGITKRVCIPLIG